MRVRVNTLPGCHDVLDVYEVDRYGNVYGTDGIELKKSYNTKKYFQVRLKVSGERRWRRIFVHRLVAMAFVSGMSELNNEVDHIDGNKENNAASNLRWTDRKGNMSNPITKDKLQGVGGIPCYVYDFRLNFIGKYDTITQARNDLHSYFSKIDTRVGKYYILSVPDLKKVLEINRKQRLTSVVITDMFTMEKRYFYSNREARRFFDNKVNITDAIQKNWTVKGRYKVRVLNYKKLIGMLDL